MNTENMMMILGSNAVVAVLTFLFSRRKENAEIDTNVLANLEKSIMVYAKIIDDLKKENNLQQKEIDDLKIRLSRLELLL
jgi:hypothetical protein